MDLFLIFVPSKLFWEIESHENGSRGNPRVHRSRSKGTLILDCLLRPLKKTSSIDLSSIDSGFSRYPSK